MYDERESDLDEEVRSTGHNPLDEEEDEEPEIRTGEEEEEN